MHDIPNSVGTTYSIGQRTNRNGAAEISYIPAGPRRVEVKLPAGFTRLRGFVDQAGRRDQGRIRVGDLVLERQ